MIESRPLGLTGLRVSTLGFGTASLGNLFRQIEDSQAHETLMAAFDVGISYFDTAPFYGRGLSERRVGDALRSQDHFVLSSKVGRLLLPDASQGDQIDQNGFLSPMPFRAVFDYTYDGILRSHEASLHRLGLPKIDILYIHDAGRRTHGNEHEAYWSQLTRGGGFRALERLRDERVIGGFGLGVNEVSVCRDAMIETRLDVILLAGRYTLLEQDGLYDFFPECGRTKTSVVVGGPYNSGILAVGTKGATAATYDYAPVTSTVLTRVASIEAIAKRHGVPLPAAALQFPLAHPLVSSVIPGLESTQQLESAVALLNLSIPSDFWDELKMEGLLRPDAPTPRLQASCLPIHKRSVASRSE